MATINSDATGVFRSTSVAGGLTHMFIFRVIALITIAAALMLLGADALSSLENGEMAMRSLTEAIDLVSPGTAGTVQSFSENGLPAFASPAVSTIMALPGWIPVGLLGLLLAFIFRIRH